MFRNKLCLLLCLVMLFSSACAESGSLISDEMIQTETVNYSKTAVVERMRDEGLMNPALMHSVYSGIVRRMTNEFEEPVQ